MTKAFIKKLTCVLMLGASLGLTGLPVVAAPDQHALDRAISDLVTQFSDGIAIGYPQFRHILFGHVFAADSNDAVAFFNIEGFGGSNYHAEYLAVFAAVPREFINGKLSKPYRLAAVSKIGGRGWRTLDWGTATIKPGSITVSGKRSLDQDAACCPSSPILLKFSINEAGVLGETEQPGP